MISLKIGRDVEKMRSAGRAARTVLEEVAAYVKPGLTTKELDEFAGQSIRKTGGVSAFLGYRHYPCNICISVNDEVVHGLAGDRRMDFGDIVSLDVGVKLNGFIGDTAMTVAVGGCDAAAQRLMEVTEQALQDAIAVAKPGNRVVDISRAVQTRVESNGFSVVREFVGHGVGRQVHEEPQIPNFVSAGDMKHSPKLRPGMTLAIEPMVNAGRPDVEHLKDGWTVATKDGQLSAHFEHTILVTESAPEILTCRGKT